MKKLLPQLQKNLGTNLKSLGLFLFFCLITSIIWVIFLQWRPGYMVSHGDAEQYAYPFLYQAAEQGGSWMDWAYDPRLLGGVKTSSTFVIPSYMNFFLLLGFSPEAIFSLGMFFLQVSFGYLGMFCSLRLAEIFQGSAISQKNSFPHWLIIPVFLLHVLSPFFAWRINGGQILYPMLFLQALLTIYLGLIRKNLNAFHFFLSLLVLYNCAQTISYPIVINAILFSAPIMLAFIYCLPKPPWSTFLWSAACIFLCAIAALPIQIPALAHFTSSDAARSLNSAPVVYAYLQGTWNDWLSSIPWALRVYNNSRSANLWPEVNFAFGPLIVALFFLPKKMRLIGASFAVSIFLTIIYSNDLKPLSDWLFNLFPMLLQFRVPNRAALAVSFLLPTVACAAFLSTKAAWRLPAKKDLQLVVAVCLFGSLILLFLPPILNEIIAWIALILIFKEKEIFRDKAIFPGSRIIFLYALIFISGFSFLQRMDPPSDFSRVDDEAKKIRSEILQQAPQLASPLSRAQFYFTSAKLYTNTAYTIGISTLDGYSQPQYRYSRLILALSNQEFDPQAMNFNISKQEPIFEALKKIYNACCEIWLDKNGAKAKIVEPMDTSAWFPEKIEFTKDFFSMAKILSAGIKMDKREFLKKIYLVETDPLVQKNLPLIKEAACENNQISSWKINKTTFSMDLILDSKSACLLNIATNFSENIYATDGNGLPLITIPSYGAILAVLVPAGTQKIILLAKDKLPPQFLWLHWLVFIFGALFSLFAYQRIKNNLN